MKNEFEYGNNNINKDLMIKEEKRQIKIGLLFLILLQIFFYSFVFLGSPFFQEDMIEFINFSLKTASTILTLILIFFTIRKWNWNLDKWGFIYNFGFWVTFLITVVFFFLNWFNSEFIVSFGLTTISQALTGIWEELIYTVLLTYLLLRYFQIYLKIKELYAKLLAVVVSALIFTLVHLPYGIWSFDEIIYNTITFIIYRLIYIFIGTFFYGMVLHGTSKAEFMALPILIIFYTLFALINWKIKKDSK